jgi:acetate kinase
MNILVINCGSSSIKFQLLDMTTEIALAAGLLECIGDTSARLSLCGAACGARTWNEPVADHAAGMALIFQTLAETGAFDDGQVPAAIGHRVVHGGEHFDRPVRIDADNLARIRQTIPLAPLHNPINLAGIVACQDLFPDLPQVAVFDTAFHQTIPERAWRYAIPETWHRDYGVRRYGFHGTSYAYVAARTAEHLGRPLDSLNLIVLHLGNGASACAIERGRSIDTSMGMTPLEGLVMGSRCGDLDPAIPGFIAREGGLSPDHVDDILNQQSGLDALCGDHDMRLILQRAEAGDMHAERALELYVYRVRKYIGAYAAVLGTVDALVFTGGIGEHAAPVRARICASLANFGMRMDLATNKGEMRPSTAISVLDSPVAILVVSTNEELEIARQTLYCLSP